MRFLESLLQETATQDFGGGVVAAVPTDPAILINPVDTPTINEQIEPIKIQQPAIGFGSYLASILPPDIATACGAFSTSFQQVKNITNIQAEKFAQVVTNIETIVGLEVNGTNVPANLELRKQGRPLIALGSGPQGTYTASDFFGCMSGLPYNGPLKNIYEKLNELATPALYAIYNNLYLAVTWEQATGIVTPTYSTSAVDDGFGNYTYYYQITGISSASFGDVGGGYGRGGAPAPTGVITGGSGATVTTSIDTSSANVATTYGRLLSALLSSTGSSVMYGSGTSPTPPAPPSTLAVEFQCPPTSTGGGTNTAYGTSGWPGMNTVVQSYIDQANAEINNINIKHKQSCQSLNDSWNATGTQLTIEQRARQTGLKPPLPDVRENYLSSFPTSIYSFVDNMADYAKSVEPHMYAQTLENISDLQTPGGQSAVASMRQQRNQDRLALIGVPLDNNIPSTLPPAEKKTLIANGSLPTGTANANIPSGSTISTVETPVETPVATPVQISPTGNVITTEPIGTYDPVTATYLPNNSKFGGQNPSTPLVTGKATTPGSFAGSPFTNLVPAELNTWYASNTLLPSTYTVQQAIEEVILCNCDCWQLA